MRNFFILACALFAFGAAEADVQIRIQSQHDTSTLSSNGERTRIDGGNMPGYVIVDHASGELLMVDPGRGQVMRSVIGADDGAGSTLSDVRLEDRGKGPRIAGYATREFAYSANGKPCGTIFASRDLLDDRQIRAMFESMRAMQQRSRTTAGVAGFMDACQLGNLGLAGALESAGAPMRMIDAEGRVQSEVLSVDTRANPGSDYYEVPAGMAVVEFGAEMGGMQQRTREMMQDMPDMQEMMQQLQQSGGQMSEEMQRQMQEQMHKMQQMLQQLQQSQ